MKLYDFPGPPSPRRIRMFLAEKGVTIDIEELNIREGAHLTPEFKAINPRCTIPTLVMDDGNILTEGDAILRYLEEKFPEKPLFGTTAEERGIINNWLHIADVDGFHAVAELLRNSLERFENRAITGSRDVAQISELAERGRNRIGFFYEDLNTQLEGRTYVAGDSYSVADISSLMVVDFAKMANVDIPENCPEVARWYADASQRASAKA